MIDAEKSYEKKLNDEKGKIEKDYKAEIKKINDELKK
jgi:phage host-nuclease inhibitor protein Gam